MGKWAEFFLLNISISLTVGCGFFFIVFSWFFGGCAVSGRSLSEKLAESGE
jgi:hypothetical protein